MTIDRWVTDAARRTPNKIAVEFGAKETLDYSTLALKIDAAVNALERADVKHGDRIAWYGMNLSLIHI